MNHVLGPDDLHEGLPEECYSFASIGNWYQNTMGWVGSPALVAYQRASGRRRPQPKVVYRCDRGRNCCRLLEIVHVDDRPILFLPEVKVTRQEALRRGSALRVYAARAQWLDEVHPTGEVTLNCRHHYMLEVRVREVVADQAATSLVSRFLPRDAARGGFPLAIMTDRFDGLDEEALNDTRRAQARFTLPEPMA